MAEKGTAVEVFPGSASPKHPLFPFFQEKAAKNRQHLKIYTLLTVVEPKRSVKRYAWKRKKDRQSERSAKTEKCDGIGREEKNHPGQSDENKHRKNKLKGHGAIPLRFAFLSSPSPTHKKRVAPGTGPGVTLPGTLVCRQAKPGDRIEGARGKSFPPHAFSVFSAFTPLRRGA